MRPMRIPLFQIDAFATHVFEGNPAAVCPLETWPDDARMQAIAGENNLAETAFFVRDAKDPARFALRWFTPKAEVDLCGHATLASAHALFELLGQAGERVTFATKSGDLVVTRDGAGTFSMLFPARPASPCEAPPALVEALGRVPREVLAAKAYLAVFDTEADVVALAPRMDRLERLDRYAVIVTAPGDPKHADFVSRFFAPKVGVPEDPVTGSAHCTLVPYWSKRLGKRALRAVQRSARGGELRCEDMGERVLLSGRAVTYLQGHIDV
jgi:PhzF family phenazine biosynthesis protein